MLFSVVFPATEDEGVPILLTRIVRTSRSDDESQAASTGAFRWLNQIISPNFLSERKWTPRWKPFFFVNPITPDMVEIDGLIISALRLRRTSSPLRIFGPSEKFDGLLRLLRPSVRLLRVSECFLNFLHFRKVRKRVKICGVVVLTGERGRPP